VSFRYTGWGASAAGRRLRLHLVDESRCKALLGSC
jgi:hypothetical protein